MYHSFAAHRRGSQTFVVVPALGSCGSKAGSRMKALRLRSWSILAAVCALLFSTATTAWASTADDKRAEAAKIASKREQLVQQAERLNEESKAAEDKLGSLSIEITAAGVTLDQQKANLDGVRQVLADVAMKTYLLGQPPQAMDILSDPASLNDSTIREGYAGSLIGAGGDAIDTVRATQQDIAKATKSLDAKKRTQADFVANLNLSRSNVTKIQAELAARATKVDGELVVLVEEEARRQQQQMLERERATAAKEAARLLADTEKKRAANLLALKSRAAAITPAARVTTPATGAGLTTVKPAALAKPSVPTKPKVPAPNDAALDLAQTEPLTTAAPQPEIPNYPAPSPGAAIAIAEAKRQLGKIYVFGTNGPDTFDCSGLTQWAWAKAGVSMSHYTVSQYGEFPHVPLESVQPGDLLFFNVDLGHMGMYLGGGLVIHAPRTGDVVKISPLSNFNVVGVARPG